jgi:hypothetical protein
MSHSVSYSVVLDQPASEVWHTVRDFNSYPVWVNGVEDSHIENDESGTTVGAVRNFGMGGGRTRQRLIAHSDIDRSFTYESCAPFVIEDESGCARTLLHYRGTLRLQPILEGNRCFAEWSSEFDCPHGDAEYWADWWATMLPVWLGSLQDYLGRQPPKARSTSRNPFGVPDVPDPDGHDVTAFANDVRLTGAAEDDNADAWDRPAASALASIEGNWSSRWNGEGFAWQRGHARISSDGERVYILFDWDDATKQGLIEARWDGHDRLVGRYLNLSAPDITRPWVGLIVDASRIDGKHSGGRIDFRR